MLRVINNIFRSITGVKRLYKQRPIPAFITNIVMYIVTGLLSFGIYKMLKDMENNGLLVIILIVLIICAISCLIYFIGMAIVIFFGAIFKIKDKEMSTKNKVFNVINIILSLGYIIGVVILVLGMLSSLKK